MGVPRRRQCRRKRMATAEGRPSHELLEISTCNGRKTRSDRLRALLPLNVQQDTLRLDHW
jgi:hypothetical protein